MYGNNTPEGAGKSLILWWKNCHLKRRELMIVLLNTVKCIIFWLWNGVGKVEWCIEKTK